VAASGWTMALVSNTKLSPVLLSYFGSTSATTPGYDACHEFPVVHTERISAVQTASGDQASSNTTQTCRYGVATTARPDARYPGYGITASLCASRRVWSTGSGEGRERVDAKLTRVSMSRFRSRRHLSVVEGYC